MESFIALREIIIKAIRSKDADSHSARHEVAQAIIDGIHAAGWGFIAPESGSETEQSRET